MIAVAMSLVKPWVSRGTLKCGHFIIPAILDSRIGDWNSESSVVTSSYLWHVNKTE